MTAEPSTIGREHWTHKGDVRLFLWEKAAGSSPGPRGAILFVHGSSMASQPTFDLQVPGRPDSSAMDYFARLGYDTWCVDMEAMAAPTSAARSTRTSRTAPTTSRRPRGTSSAREAWRHFT